MLPHIEVFPVSLPRLRAPKEHGAILAVPPLDQVDAVLLEPIRQRALLQNIGQ